MNMAAAWNDDENNNKKAQEKQKTRQNIMNANKKL